MGITGLIPFLEKSSRPANVKEFAGCSVAIDAYCWLHKGVLGCAEKLLFNKPTTIYVTYCMKYINMLLSHNIKPILVFDGQDLPAKLQTENKRRETREINRRKGVELLRAGRLAEARNFLQRGVDVTHEMALQLMKECRRRNVDCIVAPYEADSQLAYFNIQDIAQVVITEDSDLLLFGCKTVLFKMDHNGNGLLIEQSKIPLSMGMRNDAFSLDKFRLMCILSGCDYINSLPGVGLTKACKFVNGTSETEIESMLQDLSSNLNTKSVAVTEEYQQGVLTADRTFRCQLVFDPKKRRQVPLMEPKEGEAPVGEVKDTETAYQLALGNLHPKDLRKLDNYDPGDKPLCVKLSSLSECRTRDEDTSGNRNNRLLGLEGDEPPSPKRPKNREPSEDEVGGKKNIWEEWLKQMEKRTEVGRGEDEEIRKRDKERERRDEEEKRKEEDDETRKWYEEGTRKKNEEKLRREWEERNDEKQKNVGARKKVKPFNQLLEGVTFVISGYQNPERGTYRCNAMEMGAKYKLDWDNTCTHIVAAYINTPKCNQAKGKGKIVSKDWIEKCYKDKKRYPWRRFALDENDRQQVESEEEIDVENKKPATVYPSPSTSREKTEKCNGA